MRAFTVFDSRLGPCGVAWLREGFDVTHVELPGGEEEHAEIVAERLATRLRKAGIDAVAEEPPPRVQGVVDAMQRHLAGELDTLASAAVSLAGVPPFHRRVYEALRTVAPGRTVTYAELAALAGSPGASRAVGQAMAKNPCPLLVPCHRVLAAGGKTGGFSAAGGTSLKARMLAIEGVAIGASATGDLFERG